MERSHIPLTDPGIAGKRLEYSHFLHMAVPNEWRRENAILQDHIKINIFLRGDFSLFVGSRIFRPVQGDICILAPFEEHCGQICARTELEYYQLDADLSVLDALPDGRALLLRMTDRSQFPEPFFSAGSAGLSRLLPLFTELEQALDANDRLSAFCKAVQLLQVLYSLADQYGRTSSPRTEQAFLSWYPSQSIRFMEDNYSQPLTQEQIAAACGVSVSWLERVFRSETGMTLHSYLTRCRVLHAAKLLSCRTVSETALLCGFSDTSHFIREFKKRMGMTPGAYQKHTNSFRFLPERRNCQNVI